MWQDALLLFNEYDQYCQESTRASLAGLVARTCKRFSTPVAIG